MIDMSVPRPGWEPLRVSISAGWADSRNGALIGIGVKPSGEIFGMVVLESGELAALALDEFTVDWRYDAETDQWTDVNAPWSGDIEPGI